MANESFELLLARIPDIDRTIRSVGGYWKPLSALARVTEELGELCELAADGRLGSPEGAGELADLFVITSAIAIQYCSDLLSAYKDTRKTEERDPSISVCRLASSCGELARVLNYYEGEKPPKAGEQLDSVATCVARIHRSLYELSHLCGHDLHAAIGKVTDKSAHRDKQRFTKKFDPAVSPVLDSFDAIRKNTRCIFTPLARVWGGVPWDARIDFEANVLLQLPHLLRFCRIVPFEFLDAYVIEISDRRHGETVQALSRTVNQTLRTLSARDPSEANCMEKDIESAGWQFEFGGLRFFCISFAPCYPETSSRYGFGSDSTFIFMQPELPFHHLHVPRGSAANARKTIRKAYTEAGAPYDPTIMEAPLEAPRYVKPLSVGEPPVRWWESGFHDS
jgi:NTP pyrophosphatase (non-canonical NTP hydrolase)